MKFVGDKLVCVDENSVCKGCVELKRCWSDSV